MGPLVVVGVMGLALLVGWRVWKHLAKVTMVEAGQRQLSNVRVCIVHRHAGNKWYPHEMEDGRVRWYRVTHVDALDL